jgi:hypothetical protein
MKKFGISPTLRQPKEKYNHPQTNSQVDMVSQTRCSDANITKNHDSKVSLSPPS